ncbi:MAG: amidophosphoribosyltransferase [Nitrospirae bacterium]|nr:amidophosphoribosyltransferase [Nitrospirota bacterium]
MFDKFHEECGIFGITGSKDAANMTYLGLYALQHRGQEATGIVSWDGKTFHQEKGVGLVSDLFNKERLGHLKGTSAIGHNRYSTTGENHLKNVQPIMVNFALGMLALAHNGNLTNAAFLRDELEAYGAIFQSTSDSEVIIHLMAQSRQKDIIGRLTEALHRVKGAYSLVILTEHGLVGARDPYGLRPLSLGRVKDAWVLASETCAFDLIDAEFIRDVEPGELVLINENGLTSYKPFPKTDPAFCVFEYVYFSRPDSRVFDHQVYEIRKNLGRQLARETAVPADIVIPVPDSGVPAALGYAEAGNLRYETGLIRNHYVGRTFIEPEQAIRHFGVKIKLNAVQDVLKGKRVVVVDDSIVRGTTSRKIIKMIRHAGAREVHLRISSPPIISPCYYGIDTPTRSELIASSHSIEEIRSYITADSLAYLSMDGMLEAVPHKTNKYCTACFSGHYPIPFTQEEVVQIGLFDPKSD